MKKKTVVSFLTRLPLAWQAVVLRKLHIICSCTVLLLILFGSKFGLGLVFQVLIITISVLIFYNLHIIQETRRLCDLFSSSFDFSMFGLSGRNVIIEFLITFVLLFRRLQRRLNSTPIGGCVQIMPLLFLVVSSGGQTHCFVWVLASVCLSVLDVRLVVF